MASPRAEAIVWQYAMELRNRKEYPAAVVCAENGYQIKKGRSGPVPAALAPQIRLRLMNVGTLSTRVNGNLVGHCAEVDAANKLLFPLANIGVYYRPRIDFTKALRPRTFQTIPMCLNCQITFRN